MKTKKVEALKGTLAKSSTKAKRWRLCHLQGHPSLRRAGAECGKGMALEIGRRTAS
jgi:hypothetical protein